MSNARPILVLHDGDPIGLAVLARLEARGDPVRTAAGALADDLVDQALGCRALIAVGDRFATSVDVLRAADLPGLSMSVFVVRGSPDLSAIRRRGIAYAVLRTAPLLEEVATALEPALQRGRLWLARGEDTDLTLVTAADVADCAVAALDVDEACGRVMQVAAPGTVKLSTVGSLLARIRGRRLRVVHLPSWAVPALRAVGGSTFALPAALRSTVPADIPASLHGPAWRTIEDVPHDPKGARDVIGM